MANESYPESVIAPGVIESNSDDLSDHTPIAIRPKYNLTEIYQFTESAVYFVGLFLNMIILLVFSKDGFSSSTNISLFSLAVADMAVCVMYCTIIISKALQPVCYVCWKLYYYHYYDMAEVEQIPTAMTTMITSLLCWERLCCIAYPMKVKRIFTRQVTIGMILGFMVLMVLGLAVKFVAGEYESIVFNDQASFRYGYFSLFECAVKKIALAYLIELYSNAIICACPVVMFALLLLGTALFVIVFKRSIQLRKSLTAKKNKKDSTKERRLMKCILLVCIVYIITSGPINIQRMCDYFFTVARKDISISSIVISPYFFIPVQILKSINHCFNIFVYLPMNSKFRRIFCQMFCLKIFNAANQSK